MAEKYLRMYYNDDSVIHLARETAFCAGYEAAAKELAELRDLIGDIAKFSEEPKFKYQAQVLLNGLKEKYE